MTRETQEKQVGIIGLYIASLQEQILPQLQYKYPETYKALNQLMCTLQDLLFSLTLNNFLLITDTIKEINKKIAAYHGHLKELNQETQKTLKLKKIIPVLDNLKNDKETTKYPPLLLPKALASIPERHSPTSWYRAPSREDLTSEYPRTLYWLIYCINHSHSLEDISREFSSPTPIDERLRTLEGYISTVGPTKTELETLKTTFSNKKPKNGFMVPMLNEIDRVIESYLAQIPEDGPKEPSELGAYDVIRLVRPVLEHTETLTHRH